MSDKSSGHNLTLIGVFVLLFIGGFFFCMLMPAVQAVREAARRAACIGTQRMIGISLHNYHDANRCFPPSMREKPAGHFLSSTAPVPGTDNTSGTGADYSFHVYILPYMEYGGVAQLLNVQSGYPFDGLPDRKEAAKIPTIRRFSKANGVVQLCASFVGPCWSDAPEYGNQPTAISNYVALGATHLDSLYRTETQPIGGTSHPNGTIYPGSSTSIDDMVDGTTNTFVVCETREQGYAAWIDGTTAAVVGLAEQSRPAFVQREDQTYYSPADGVRTTLNWGIDDRSQGQFYLPAADHSGSRPWIHGPSSFHPGLVNHLMGDASVRSVQDGIDPALYMHLITRDGGESVNKFFE